MAKQRLVPQPGSPVRLADYDPDYVGGYDKDKARKETAALAQKLAALQEKLYAESQQALLIVLQAMDAGGKDGTIKRVFDSANPQGVQITSFKTPTPPERARDFLWRVHHAVPAKGYIGIFNRSHYEDVLVPRVQALVPPDALERRYDQINNFERLLVENGTRVIKFFLHISRDEQKKRLQQRLDRPEKHWKFNPDDLKTRQQWDAYMAAYEVALTRCNTDVAPWHIVPANRKWYRNLVVTRAIVETLESMDPQFPAPAAPLDGIVIPD